MKRRRWASGAGLAVVGAASLVWLFPFRGLRHLEGFTVVLLVVVSFALILVGVGLLGGRRLLAPVLLAAGLLGGFLAAVPDRECVVTFRASLGAVSGLLFVAGSILTTYTLLERRSGPKSKSAGPRGS